jgi:hypothetical protein
VRTAGVAGLALTPLSGVWFRAIQPQFWTTSFKTLHTRGIASRFNPGNNRFDTFYLAENHLVALLEVGALVGTASPGGLVAVPHRPWAVINVTVRLGSVVDLTRLSQRKAVRTSVQELTGDWRNYAIRHQLSGVKGAAPHPPTQRLGETVFLRSDVEGVVSYSAKQAYSRVLCVFPQRLKPGSRLSFFDPTTGRTLSMP